MRQSRQSSIFFGVALTLGMAMPALVAGQEKKAPPAKPPGHTTGSRVPGLPEPEAGPRLDGIYMTFLYGYKGFTERKFYYFTPAGYVSIKPFGGVDQLDFAKQAKATPEAIGSYSIADNRLTIHLANQTTVTMKYGVVKNGVEFDGLYAFKAEPYKPGATLEGSYKGFRLIELHAGSTSLEWVLTFKKDGTYARVVNGVIAPKNSESSESTTSQTGTYTVTGNTLQLKASDGKTTSYTIFPYGEAAKDVELFIDKDSFKPAK